MMSTPSSAFESLLPRLLTILQVTQRPEGTSNVRNKQDLLQAIQAFRESLNHSRSLASALPGGELLIEEQDEIIAMLERLREKKRSQLREFSDKVIDTKAAGHSVPLYAGGSGAAGTNAQMEVDSNASTPA
ncbi:hypothetical protein F5148DRAFT_1178056 [Russula earlei]|uniref:Uncharacterized protein n=1 Tax=Russula earlei TaxID=71964 RepID=A0ACC0UHR1_9AGAM|nr:hypothetical protein F5148DRAFT_1178056 [Russula earlei]